ncbi:MAG: LCP family protein [Coriobacteriales bacterium]|nr:LCP family protein [Coriobacteriales bacterium]
MREQERSRRTAQRPSSQTASLRAASHAVGASGGHGRGHRRDDERDARDEKKLKTWKKALIISLAALVVLVLAAVAVVFTYIGSLDRKLAMDPIELDDLQQVTVPQPSDPKEPYYILVLGSDARQQGATSRSDTIMLCRLDPEANSASILSIPRDTKVELAGRGTQKINAALAFGGPAGAVKAVSDFVGVEIAHVVLIDFEGFADLVDRLGGVTINVPAYSTYEGIELQPGLQTLNGAQALVFVRDRYSYALGDFQRAANQRTLLKAIARKIIEAPANEIPGYVNSLAECTTTDLTAKELIDLALSFRGMNVDADMYTGQVPSTTGMIGNVSYVLTKEEEWAGVREKFVNGVVPFVDESNQPAVVE